MFTRALTRGIPNTYEAAVVETSPSEPFDLPLARSQHQAYVHALRQASLEIIELPPDDRFPDCCFVEDCALVADGVALITNPGTSSRRGEQEAIKEVLSRSFRIEKMTMPAMLEGGDCLRVGKRLFVGKSDRTNEAGIERVREVFEPQGFGITAIPVTDVLHLKCVCSGLGTDKIVLGERTIPREYFGDVDVVEIPNHEAYAANCVSINNTVLMASGFPEMRRTIESLGFNIVPLETSEIRKADGSLTCLSILF